MAGESKTSSTAFEDMMLALFALLLVGRIFEQGPAMLQKHFGIDVENKQYLVAGVGLSATTPLGTRVSTPNGTTFYSEPGSGSETGTLLPGSSVFLDDGPKVVNGERWWQVEDQRTGKKGWVRESDLILEGVGGIGPTTKLGSKAKVLLDTSIWEKPGGLHSSGTITKGEKGELTKGPENENGSRWWFFDRDAGEDGWLPESVLMLASDASWKEGSPVKGNFTANVFERAGGGQVTGFLREDEKAKILGGPVDVGGSLWWLVRTQAKIEGWVPENALKDASITGWFKGFFVFIMVLGTVVTLSLLAGIIYITIRTNQIRARELKRIKEAIPKKEEPKRNERWEKVMAHVSSDSPSDWRLAIIEADVILDDLLTQIGYQGISLGDKLKQVSKGDMRSVDMAWEAHKVRNQIAHEGSDLVLTKREAKRVINMYATVFAELKYI